MKTLTPQEVSDWLRQNRQVEGPHNAALEDVSALLHVQFRVPIRYLQIESFVREFLDREIFEGDMLLQVTDSSPYDDTKHFIIGALWQSAGEKRETGEVTGFLITKEERASAAGLFSIMTCFGWSCYLYGTHDQVVLYNWEGEIFDAWTSTPA